MACRVCGVEFGALTPPTCQQLVRALFAPSACEVEELGEGLRQGQAADTCAGHGMRIRSGAPDCTASKRADTDKMPRSYGIRHHHHHQRIKNMPIVVSEQDWERVDPAKDGCTDLATAIHIHDTVNACI
jgi:hypothetical protein